MDINAEALVMDVLDYKSLPQADVSLVLKTLPCLEQIKKGAGFRLLEEINSSLIAISFPIRSLGGRNKGMEQYYTSKFMKWIETKNWNVNEMKFQTELVFLVKK
jgi:16S rRNA (guanine(1405)-N(7))-methyltransferase